MRRAPGRAYAPRSTRRRLAGQGLGLGVGGDLFDRDRTKVTPGDPPALARLQFQADLIHKHRVPASPAQLRELGGGLEAWLAAGGDRGCLDASGHLRSDPEARDWTPEPPPRHGLGLRPY